MNIPNFTQQFPDEDSSIAYLKEQREHTHVVFKRCGCKAQSWNLKEMPFECRLCHSKQSLRSEIIMKHSKLPFHYWITAMLLLTVTKNFSTEELHRQLGHKLYQPIWKMVCKLRDVMGKRDERYQLSG